MFLITCDNKGCYKQSEATLDLGTNEVICAECGNAIKNVTPFLKTGMKTIGQTSRKKEATKSYSVDCGACKRKCQPKVIKNKAYCSLCNSQLNLSAPYIQLLINRPREEE